MQNRPRNGYQKRKPGKGVLSKDVILTLFLKLQHQKKGLFRGIMLEKYLKNEHVASMTVCIMSIEWCQRWYKDRPHETNIYPFKGREFSKGEKWN
jgi:homoaconitase/3-isopropylmalate dehydratase large subunit